MAEYTIRQGFSIVRGTDVFSGGDTVELSELEFAINKHKLEGVGATVVPISVPEDVTSSLYSFPAPYFSSITPDKILGNNAERELTLLIQGSFFTPDTQVTSSEFTVSDVEFKSDNLLVVRGVSAIAFGFINLEIDNGSVISIESALEVVDLASGIIDLRTGGTEFSNSAIEMREDMSFTRTSRGIYFTGFDIWNSWVRFVGDNDLWIWDRSVKRTLSWIFTNTSATMMGIGSREIDPTSQNQWSQAEIMGYFSSGSRFTGFYGNDGTLGSAVNFRTTASVNSGTVKKLVLENNGEPGSSYTLYELPSGNIEDWIDTSKILRSGTMPEIMSADAEQIMPFVIPRDGQQTFFLGFILD